MQGRVCHECRLWRCEGRWEAIVPYPRCVGCMGSSWEAMTAVLTPTLELERGMRGIVL
jgi:hypothetical protein